MNLGTIGKALANQAIEHTKNTVLDTVRTPEAPKAPAPTPPADTESTILGQIHAMQRPLTQEQELVVSVRAGDDMLRVSEIFVPNAHVLVFAGSDAAGNITRLISPVNAAQVLCKVVKVPPGTNPVRVNILTPKAPPKPGA